MFAIRVLEPRVLVVVWDAGQWKLTLCWQGQSSRLMCGSNGRTVEITETTKYCWIRRSNLKVKSMLVGQGL